MKRSVRFRVFVGAVLVDERTIEAESLGGEVIEELTTAHALAADLAHMAGLRWLIEIRFWDGEHVRFGTDPEGMVEPIEVSLPRLMSYLGGEGPIPETP